MEGRCSACMEMCQAEYDDGKQLLPDLGHGGRQMWMEVDRPQWISNCCFAPLLEDGECSHEDQEGDVS